MQRLDVSACSLAQHLDGGMYTVRGLLEGTLSIDVKLASTIAQHLGGTASFWTNRQKIYDVALERATDRATAIEADDWLLLPVPGSKPRGQLTPDKLRSEVQRRLTFFNVATMSSWAERYKRVCSDTLYRKSDAFTSDDALTLMWLRCGEIGADLVTTRPWKAENLQDRLIEIRKLSKLRNPASFLPKLKSLCAEAGVAVVAKRAPRGCPASGAVRMVTPDKALMLLSFRGLSDDRFWFTVFHEVGHLLLHSNRTFVDTDLDGSSDAEHEANAFASRCIVPEQHVEEFDALEPKAEKVMRFAVKMGVSSGLIVGQMQHQNAADHDQLNYLKRRWKWAQLEPLLD